MGGKRGIDSRFRSMRGGERESSKAFIIFLVCPKRWGSYLYRGQGEGSNLGRGQG
jgi:hypothetical protein